MATWCRASVEGTLLDVVVQPKASREGLGPVQGERLKVRVHAPPADNEANEAVIALVAKRVGVPRSAVTIASGRTGRRKTLLVRSLTPPVVLERLGEDAVG
ncbi:MAG: DUF167 domain-containing protein [Deltaproteobacteria bacterium]|nr:DUF167 domain-containing protein [Deltaproteobacteria bacterium]